MKRTGDGILVEFRSVVDAVRCSIEVQNGMVDRNAGLPAERQIWFRAGIHLGDVIEEADGDLMGDGVNIASRLDESEKSVFWVGIMTQPQQEIIRISNQRITLIVNCVIAARCVRH